MSTYIRKIEIEGLWGIHNFRWELSPGVNILSGGNGSGKSTVLRCLADMFQQGCLSQKREHLVTRASVTFDDDVKVDSLHKFNPEPYKVQVISTFDMMLKESEAVRKLSSGEVVTDLDWELYKLHSAYLDYQLEVSKEMIAALSAGRPTCEISAHKELYYDTVDSLFESTHKRIDRTSNSLNFNLRGQRISPVQLSSGEKQILIILTSALIRNRQESIMILDEPEISLHFDWQKRLIDDILQLNPKTQLIIATHSPAVVMKGWVDRVSEMSELLEPMNH